MKLCQFKLIVCQKCVSSNKASSAKKHIDWLHKLQTFW